MCRTLHVHEEQKVMNERGKVNILMLYYSLNRDRRPSTWTQQISWEISSLSPSVSGPAFTAPPGEKKQSQPQFTNTHIPPAIKLMHRCNITQHSGLIDWLIDWLG